MNHQHQEGRSAELAALRADIAAFLTYLLRETGASINTHISYSAALNCFASWYVTGAMANYLRPTLKEFREFLVFLVDVKGLAPSSIASRLGALTSFYRYLALEERVDSEAVFRLESLDRPAMEKRLPVTITPAEAENLIAAVRAGQSVYHGRDRAVLETLYGTGCRASELCNMEMRNLHLDERSVLIDGKRKKQRMGLLGESAHRAITDYVTNHRPKLVKRKPVAPWLFVSNRGGKLSRFLIWLIVKRYAVRAGITKRISPHVLRHAFASHLLQGGASIREIQELLGHESIITTQRYTHVDPTQLKALHRKYHPRGGGDLRLYDPSADEEQRKAA